MARAKSTKTNRDILRVLQKAKPPLRKAILREADKGVVYSICEICDNTLAGNVPLNSQQKSQLKKYQSILRQLSQNGGHWKTKKKTLVQHGGAFLPILLSVLSSVLPALL